MSSCLAVVSPAQIEAMANTINKVAKTVCGLMSVPSVRLHPSMNLGTKIPSRKS